MREHEHTPEQVNAAKDRINKALEYGLVEYYVRFETKDFADTRIRVTEEYCTIFVDTIEEKLDDADYVLELYQNFDKAFNKSVIRSILKFFISITEIVGKEELLDLCSVVVPLLCKEKFEKKVIEVFERHGFE